MSINWAHPFGRKATIALVIILAAIAVWFLIGRLFPSNPPGPTESERRSDSLAITKPIDKALIDSSNARIDARRDSSAAAVAAALTSEIRARRARVRADSLAEVAAHAADSARAWHAAYEERTLEAVGLRSTVASKDVIITNLKADTTELRFQLGIVNNRLATTEDVNLGLRKDLSRARQCKILRLVNCPSRIQTAAITLVTYVAIDRYRQR